jgi:hypothetical protein
VATSTTTGFSVPSAEPAAQPAELHRNRRRAISPEAGHALEILSHSIEYLTDETVHRCGSFSELNEQYEAVQLLMELNRQIYFECPEMETLGERCRELLWKVHHRLRGSAQQN